MRIIITGATGFIGSAIVRRFMDEDISALVRKGSNTANLKAKGIALIEGDITDAAGLAESFKGYDAVIHSAGLVTDWDRKDEFIASNVVGTNNVLHACRIAGVKRLMYLSTVDIFGHRHKSIINESSPVAVPAGWYGKSKLLAEQSVRKAMGEGWIDISVIYPPWIYGEGDRHFIPEVIQALKTKSLVYFRSGGRHTIELCHVDNLAEAVHVIFKSNESLGRGFIVCDEPKLTLRAFLQAIAFRLGLPECNASLPYPVVYGVAMVMECTYRLLGVRNRPLLTRHAVSMMGNHVEYSIEAIEKLGYRQKYHYADYVASLENVATDPGLGCKTKG